MLLEHQILTNSHRANQAFAFAVVGDVGQAEPESLAGVQVGDVAIAEKDLSLIQRAKADDRLRELLLAIPIHAGDAKNFVVEVEGDEVKAGGRNIVDF